MREDFGAVDWPACLPFSQFCPAQVKCLRTERPIGPGGLAGGIGAGCEVVGNIAQPLVGGALGAAVDHDQIVVCKVIEQRDHAVFEQRQPVFHACEPAAFADRLVKRIARGIGAELLAVAGAEAFDAVIIEQGLAGRKQQVLLARADRALGVGIEQP